MRGALMFDYDPYYNEIIDRTRLIVDTIDWLKDLSEKLKKDGLIGYSLSVKQYADYMERVR